MSSLRRLAETLAWNDDAGRAALEDAVECIEQMARDRAKRYWHSTGACNSSFCEAHPSESSWVQSNWPLFVGPKYRSLVMTVEVPEMGPVVEDVTS